ncbi:hypothetical protein MG290_01705 [Flavobacterium sp. CBA20B-1]|uniref:hypothetical protein n=1 Tax=unclassified Flavobacterium TaxID=196869 RepID=UPI00222400F9|nr:MULTISPECIES: hypothetical protein [unclassified Flavobacterium]WCM42411.1 hypothetical protein MG290_01705 [Flavobacterium sp. CBA20B-1]
MDRTLNLVLEKLTQLTNRLNSIAQNSKKIHELSDFVPNEEADLYIAVSDGTSTGKKIYKATEVTSEEFENLKNLELSNPLGSSILQIKDSEGNILATLDQSYLDGNKVSLAVNQETNALELLDFVGEPLSIIPISSFTEAPKQKQIFVHTLTPTDIEQATITLELQATPLLNEFYDLHINGLYVNDDDYIVQDHQVIIAKSNIGYEILAGMKLTFRYRY